MLNKKTRFWNHSICHGAKGSQDSKFLPQVFWNHSICHGAKGKLLQSILYP